MFGRRRFCYSSTKRRTCVRDTPWSGINGCVGPWGQHSNSPQGLARSPRSVEPEASSARVLGVRRPRTMGYLHRRLSLDDVVQNVIGMAAPRTYSVVGFQQADPRSGSAEEFGGRCCGPGDIGH
jgi:hypothetical protein